MNCLSDGVQVLQDGTILKGKFYYDSYILSGHFVQDVGRGQFISEDEHYAGTYERDEYNDKCYELSGKAQATDLKSRMLKVKTKQPSCNLNLICRILG